MLRALRIPLVFIFTIIFQCNLVTAQEVAKLDSASGEVKALLAGEKEFKPVQLGQSFKVNDTIKTGKNGKVGLLFASGILLRLASGTTMTFDPSQLGTQDVVNINTGKAYVLSREPSNSPLIRSPAVTTAIRGTEIALEVTAKHTTVSVLKGEVECENKLGKVSLREGERAETTLGQAPVKSVLLSPTDAVQWTAYMPDTSGLRNSATHEIDDQAIRAFTELSANHKDAAKKTIRAALDKNDQSSLAHLVNSYISQAEFDLGAARSSLARARQLSPQDPLIISRLAEMELSFGNIAPAKSLIAEALAIQPTHAYALSISGFIHLFEREIDPAEQEFKQAILADSTLSLPRLGLALTRIAAGDLALGRKELEKAIYLDPNIAIYRSYLGKAYFEEERETLAGSEYDQAIRLDPQDPTPYLYRAFNSLSQNKPVEALNDIETSIANNDNRAVYRSSLLLDRDLGVRSAGLAEVFRSLGFSQAARIEAIKSVNKDYKNYSAHRLLADSNDSIFLSDAALSEQQIATLLAPLSFNLYNNAGATSASINDYNSLFDRDQTRSGVGVNSSSYSDLIAPNVSTSGKKDNLGYLLSYDGDYQNGSRRNNFFRQNRFNLALQYEPTSRQHFVFSALAEDLRARDNAAANDDVELNQYEVSLGYRSELNSQASLILEQRLGKNNNSYLSSLAERTILISQEVDGELLSDFDETISNEFSREKVDSSRTTAQIVYASSLVDIVGGAQAFISDNARHEDSLIEADAYEVFNNIGYHLNSRGDNGLRSFDYYGYTTWHLSEYADFNLGGTYTDLELEQREVSPFIDGVFDRSRFNPKVGLTIYPSSSTTVRTAYFEGLRKSALEDIAQLEPTLVGGFNQRFSDFSGTISRNIAGGIDYKLASSTYTGLEVARRHTISREIAGISSVLLDQEALPISTSTDLYDPFDNHSNQNILKAYFYQVLNKRWVFTTDYERITSERTDPDIYQDVDLDRASATIRYFDPCGWFAFSRGTWREQDRNGSDYLVDGKSDFWIMDLGLGYRIPKRHGSFVLELNNLFDRDFTYDQSFGFEEFVNQGIGGRLVFNYNF